MSMPVLALAARSFRLSARGWGIYALRFIFLSFTLFCLFIAWASSSSFSAPGRTLFTSICFLDLFFIALAGASSFATSVAEEKEAGTLGLLRMTDLSPLAILLGKSAGPLAEMIFLLGAQFPFMLLAITLGGVSFPQIVAAYLTLLGFILFVAGAGVFASTCRAQINQAQGLTVLILFAVFLGPPIAYGLSQVIVTSREWASISPYVLPWVGLLRFLNSLTAFMQLYMINSVAFAGPVLRPGAIAHALAGLGFYLAAWLTFERFNRDDPVVAPSRLKLPIPLRRRSTTSHPRAWTGLSALAWKDYFVAHGGLTGATIRSLLYVSLTMVIVLFATNVFDASIGTEEIGGIMAGLAFWALAGEAVVIAARVFEEEVRWQTLSALTVTPHQLAHIAYAKILGSLLALIPAAALLALGLLLMLKGDDPYRALREIFYNSAWGYFWIIEGVCFVHLVVLLSLYVKWAAVPVAMGVAAMGHMLYFGGMGLLDTIGPFRLYNSEGFIFGVLSCILLGLTAGFHVRIGRRLADLARE